MNPFRHLRRWGWVVAGAALLAVALAAAFRPSECQVERVTTTSAAADPRSCKPTSPVQITLTEESRGIWRIRLEAESPVDDAVVRLGSGAPGNESAVAVVWTGSLAAGESREIQARYPAPPGEARVWAEVAAGEGVDSRQRARATLATRGGLAIASAESPADPGRVVLDPETGSQVVEYPGESGSTP